MIFRFYNLILILLVYMAWRLLPAMPSGAAGTLGLTLTTVWLVAAGVLITINVRARSGRQVLPDRLAAASWFALGSISSLFVLTAIRDLLLLIAWVSAPLLSSFTALPQLKAGSAIAVPVLAALLTLIGLFNARRRAKVLPVDVPIVGLPVALHGFTIVQISDIHIGATIKRGYVEAIVDAVNSLNADMIAVTGDLVDGSVQRLSHHTQPLSRLAARHGAFFVTGNHEYYSGARPWLTELRRLGLHVLMNEHEVIQHDGTAVVVAGVTDYNAHHFEPTQRSDPAAALAGAPTGALKVLLAHQPRSAFAAAPAGFDLQLSGHTHGGQFLPWTFFVRLQQPFTAGLHRLGGLWVYISRGTGYWGPPLRLGAPSEITRIRLVAA